MSAHSLSSSHDAVLTPERQVGLWLLIVALAVAAMVLVGGLTRLTESGLSITEWKPVTGALPPLTEADWRAEFEKYQAIPQYRLMNAGMDLAAFKAIYWWEWGHRLLGRVIGLLFAVPALIFFLQGKLRRADLPRMAILFCLGGLQGLVGWLMVKSGLTDDRVNVSQYRLAAHLGLALLIYSALIWTALDWLDRRGRGRAPGSARRGLIVLTALVGLAVYGQVLLGALVAGLRAGLIYNTWPLMDGALWPDAAFPAEAGWRAVFEDPTTAQLDHRLWAYVVAAGIVWLWLKARREGGLIARRADWMLGALALQIGLGIGTLIAVVPIGLAVAHQAGAVLLLSTILLLGHGLVRDEPV